jgi:hypothetical protein
MGADREDKLAWPEQKAIGPMQSAAVIGTGTL